MNLTEDLKSKAKKLGADLVGIAPIERFEGAPKLYHPQNLLPQTKSVISIAIRQLHGTLAPQEYWVEHYQYQTYGYGWLSNIRLNWVAFEIGRFLEDKGYLTCPYPSFFQGKKAAISNRHSAVAAGIAKFGWNNLAMSPRFGTKQRFVTVMTTAELEPDPMIEDDICDKCMKCVDACPVGAISRDEPVEFEIAGHPIRMAKVDKGKCGPCHSGKGPGFENSYPTFVTFSGGGHCGMCLIKCPKGTYKPS